MIALVEGAKKTRTRMRLLFTILLVAAFTLVFSLLCTTTLPFSIFSVDVAGQREPVTVTVLLALLVCLIPTTIGGLLSAIGIAGMDRLVRANVIAMSGAPWKRPATWMYCCSTRRAQSRWAIDKRPFHPGQGFRGADLADAAQLVLTCGRNAGRSQHRSAGQGRYSGFANAKSRNSMHISFPSPPRRA